MVVPTFSTCVRPVFVKRAACAQDWLVLHAGRTAAVMMTCCLGCAEDPLAHPSGDDGSPHNHFRGPYSWKVYEWPRPCLSLAFTQDTTVAGALRPRGVAALDTHVIVGAVAPRHLER